MDTDQKIETIKNWLGTGSINVFGLPFAGKDTQCHVLTKLFLGQLIGGGDILRSQATADEMGPTNSGDVAPTDLYLRLILPYLLHEELQHKPLVLSSVGRSHGEEPFIMDATEKSGHTLKAVIYLAISEDDVWKRHKESSLHMHRGQRDDDEEEVLRTRLETLQNNTQKVIEFYRQKSLLIEVDGTKTSEEVTESIIDSLWRLATK